MAETRYRIPFEEFSENLDRIFERVIREKEALLINTRHFSRISNLQLYSFP